MKILKRVLGVLIIAAVFIVPALAAGFPIGQLLVAVGVTGAIALVLWVAVWLIMSE